MTPGPQRVVLIAAVARNGVIGNDGGLPWHLPGDLAYFRRQTWGKPVIFGRRTLEAVGKPLPGRCCIVLTRTPKVGCHGAITAPDLDSALARARVEAERMDASEIMVAGGATVFDATLPIADELRLTLVDLAPQGDVHFPPIDPAVWQEFERVPAVAHPKDQAGYAFARLLRKHPNGD